MDQHYFGELVGYWRVACPPHWSSFAVGATQDPGTAGFSVFRAAMGTQTLLANAGVGTAAGAFNMMSGLAGLDGSYIIGFCGTGRTGDANPYVATANSGALIVTPEPSSLPMLGAGLLALAILPGRRTLTA